MPKIQTEVAAMRIVPLTRKVAQEWISEHHRHSGVPVGDVIRCGVEHRGELVGVACAGRPVARGFDDGTTLEITRVCVVDGCPPNACSMLYAALCRAGKALGWGRVYTYTLTSEDAASVKASGFTHDADIPARPTWSTPSRPRNTAKRPTETKVRWRRLL